MKGDAAPQGEDKVPAGTEKDQGTKKREVNKNYNLDRIPVNLSDQQDYAASMIERLLEFRQERDRVQLLNQHLQKIDKLDSSVKRLLIQRLSEKVNIDYHKLVQDEQAHA